MAALQTIEVRGASSASLPRIGSAGLIVDDSGRILVGRRRKQPNFGKWVLPGGKIEPYESIIEALIRETEEETGLQIAVTGQAGVFEIIRPPEEHRLIVYNWARPIGGTLAAGSDLSELQFVSSKDADQVELSDFVRAVLRSVGWLGGGVRPHAGTSPSHAGELHVTGEVVTQDANRDALVPFPHPR
jgi:8-oxo-dGTP diphosphatase